jgi:hypothetical protein
MKRSITVFICATIATAALLPFNALAGTKKNDPDKKEVLKEIEEIGGDHYVEKMKVSQLCNLKFEAADGEDDYYHIYNASLKEGGYRIIIYNNKPEYLGFYTSPYEGVDYEEGAILLDSGESDEDGNSVYFNLPIPNKGPAAKVRIDGTPVSFVKNPKLEEAEKAAGDMAAGGIPVVPKETSASGEVIDYRDWTITMQGKEITVNAKFEKVEKGKVYIKNAKNGKVAAIPGSALSDADKEYVTRISAK